jgi:outer membrane protein assembly factor BamD
MWLIPLVFLVNCKDKEFDPDDPQKSFAIAKEPYDDRNFEIALNKLGEFKARFPYSQYAIEAGLLIANSHFELSQYPEAAASYEQFVKLHPKHPQIDFAMFRIGESYWAEAPEEIDREQEYTERAVMEWQKLLDRNTGSEYSVKARDLMEKGKRRIAESEQFIARFYCKREIWHACAFRYLALSEKFPEFREMRQDALMNAADALEKLASIKAQDPDSDANLYFKNMDSKQITAKSLELRNRAQVLLRKD